MRGQKSGHTGHGTASVDLDRANRRSSHESAADIQVLGRLSPAAVTHWPTVAKQLANAGVLGSVDARSVACYCEAFARWCSAADELAKMLIEFGVKSSRRAQEQANVALDPSQLRADTAETITEPRQRAHNAIMRRDEVERETGLSRSTIYKRIKDGTFPAPLKIGPGSIGWRVSDIEAFLASPAHYKVAVRTD